MIVYGIKNCDTMKKAFTWLDNHKVEYTFHDYRKPGLTEVDIENFLKLTDLESFVNKRSTSWRALSDEEKLAVMNPKTAGPILIAHPTLIKRPFIVDGDRVIIGFSEASFTEAFTK